MPDLFIFILGSNISIVCVNCVRSCQKILIIKLIDFLDISGKLDNNYVTGQPSNGIRVRICGKSVDDTISTDKINLNEKEFNINKNPYQKIC